MELKDFIKTAISDILSTVSEISSSNYKARCATLASRDKDFTYRRHKRRRIAGKRANSRCILSLGSLQ